jgi:multicomponent Na+:H+ antiporter subunit E
VIAFAYLSRRRRGDAPAPRPEGASPRRSAASAARVAAVALIWVALWGDARPAVWLAGAGVGLASLVVLPVRGPLQVRPVGVLRLLVEVLRQLVVATAGVVRVVLAPRPAGGTRTLRVTTHLSDSRRLALICSLVTLTPGTTVVELHPDRGELDVNVLGSQSDPQVREDVTRLAAAIRGALGPSPSSGGGPR